MNVVWVSSHIADPTLGGGWAYEYELLARAAADHRVTVVTGELTADDPVPDAVADLGVRVVGARVPLRRLPTGKVSFLALLARTASPTGAWRFEPVRQSMLDSVRRIEAADAVDLVHVFPQESAPIAAGCDAPAALLLGDSFAVQADRELHAATTTKDRLRLTLERRNATRWERRWYPQASAVACVSEADASALHASCGIDVGVVPVAVGDEWFVEPAAPRSDNLVLLAGALDYRPNVDAIVWFCADVWPLVRQQHPAARLRVVGRRPEREVTTSVAAAGGELHADVPDVRPHYWEAAVAVSPIRLGSGVKNKVLHAAACRAPQVGTGFAFDGTGAVDGRDVLMADDAAGLAEAVVATLRDPAAARRRATYGHDLAVRHSRDAAGAALEVLWDRALRRRHAPV